MKTRAALVLVAAACMIPAAGFSADRPGAKYTATGLLRISRQAPFIIFPPAHQDSEQEFETYKKTQEQLLKSRFVMLAALRKPEVAKLPDVQTVQHVADAVRWLQSLVKVEFPGDAEIMTVSVTTGDPHESATLARAVVDAYFREVVEAERDQKRQRLNELDRACVEKETEIRGKLEDLKKLAETLGVSDSETLTMKQKLALEELYEYRKELRQLQAELRSFKRDLAVQKAVAARRQRCGPRPDSQGDQAAGGFHCRNDRAGVGDQRDVERLQREAERFGMSTVDIEMMRADIKNLNAVWHEITKERERLRIEIHATPALRSCNGRRAGKQGLVDLNAWRNARNDERAPPGHPPPVRPRASAGVLGRPRSRPARIAGPADRGDRLRP